MRTARGHVSVPRVHHQRVVDDEHMSILPLNSAIKSVRHRTHRQPSMGTPTPKTNASLPLLRAVSTSSFIAALNSSYQVRIRELSETVLKESDPCAIRLLTRLPPTTSQLAVVKSAAPVQHRFGFPSRRRRIDTSQLSASFKRARAQSPLFQNGKGHKCTRVKGDPPTHQSTQGCDPHTATLCSSQHCSLRPNEGKERK